jgi:hypothetical protein
VPVAAAEETPLPRPLYKSWWIWTIAGVVVAGAAGTISGSMCGFNTATPPVSVCMTGRTTTCYDSFRGCYACNSSGCSYSSANDINCN